MMKRLMEKCEIEDPSDSDCESKKEVIIFSNSDDDENKTISDNDDDDENKTISDNDDDESNKTTSDNDDDEKSNKSDSDEEKEETVKIINKYIDKHGYVKTKKILIPILREKKKERKITCNLCNKKVKVGNFNKHVKNKSHKNVIEKYNKFISDLKKTSKIVSKKDKIIIDELIKIYQDELNKSNK